MGYINYKDKKEFVTDMKKTYRAADITLQNPPLKVLRISSHLNIDMPLVLEGKFEELVAFWIPAEIRKLIYTTNPIENLNRNIKNIPKIKVSQI